MSDTLQRISWGCGSRRGRLPFSGIPEAGIRCRMIVGWRIHDWDHLMGHGINLAWCCANSCNWFSCDFVPLGYGWFSRPAFGPNVSDFSPKQNLGISWHGLTEARTERLEGRKSRFSPCQNATILPQPELGLFSLFVTKRDNPKGICVSPQGSGLKKLCRNPINLCPVPDF